MAYLREGIAEAFRLVSSGDPELFHAVWVSIVCTVTAVTLASVLAVPYGAWLGLKKPRGHGVQVFLLRIGMFVPTVVVGLIVFGLISRRGLLGDLDLLYTKGAIVMGEFLLAFPILGALSHAATKDLAPVVLETPRTLGAGRLCTLVTVLGEVRTALVAAYLAAFARCFSELGIAIPVGGNLELKTRTLASSVVLELRMGNFGEALAPGLVLMAIAALVALVAHLVSREDPR